ncbi:hypothetical protein EVAR_5248_1 [Eumeta japonica]|uniref:Uncharacterized protein n=1 Tax=Eumeta variegata TaxID=151549 RepID=A0A4C1XQ13_EUMVA|nr:hypothetical protein EVAR_5248_1 [Eumeta japonica]
MRKVVLSVIRHNRNCNNSPRRALRKIVANELVPIPTGGWGGGVPLPSRRRELAFLIRFYSSRLPLAPPPLFHSRHFKNPFAIFRYGELTRNEEHIRLLPI